MPNCLYIFFLHYNESPVCFFTQYPYFTYTDCVFHTFPSLWPFCFLYFYNVSKKSNTWIDLDSSQTICFTVGIQTILTNTCQRVSNNMINSKNVYCMYFWCLPSNCVANDGLSSPREWTPYGSNIQAKKKDVYCGVLDPQRQGWRLSRNRPELSFKIYSDNTITISTIILPHVQHV